jgi:outer membrane protein assembly factor BamB
MANLKSKATTIAISVFLMLAMAISLLPATNAQSERPTYAFIGATPNPVGVGQEVLLHIGISQQTYTTYQSYTGLTVTIIDPYDHETTLDNGGPGYKTDATGGTGTNFTPEKEGVYKLQSHFPAQTIDIYSFFGTVTGQEDLAASDSEWITLVVQAEPVPYYPEAPLPTEYWTRPINAQFHSWAPIAGNWLRPAGSYTMPPIPKYHPNNEDAPDTAHILWTKQYVQGGLAGGELGNVQYEMGDAYEGKFLGSVIIDGVLYYNQYEEQQASGASSEPAAQNVIAVNLKTGEEIWRMNWENKRLAFGQVYMFDGFNYHGAFAYLWTVSGSTWKAYDPLSGRWVYTITDVPSSDYNVYGPKGEIIRYTVDTRNGWMTKWNSSKTVNPQTAGSVGDGSWEPIGSIFNGTRGIEWNVTIPTGLPGSVAHYSLDKVFGSTSAGIFGAANVSSITSWAIDCTDDSVEDGTANMVFNEEWDTPGGYDGTTYVWTDASFEDEVFIISNKETRRYYGFSLKTGKHMWTSDPEHYLAFYDKWYGPAYGYGNFYTGRMTGVVTCYNITTGKVKWTYNVTDKYAEILWSNNFPIEYHFLADGKICLSYGEHSPIIPTGRGAPMVVLDAETGEEIWTLSWFNNWWGGHVIIGDSVMAGLNAYDGRIYSIGKGPSATTVSAAPKISVNGDAVLVEGTVMDISPGTEDYALAARFPNGVPAMSDANMTDWMEYVYMQYPKPAEMVGVDVTISVIDPNGNTPTVATATSDASGGFCCEFIPEVSGMYTVIATFEGSGAYCSSSATTHLKVNDAIVTPPPTETPAPMTDAYVLGLGGVSIAAIVAIGLVIILMLRKR